MEEFLAYLREVNAYIAENGGRSGQAYYNVLYKINPGLAASIDDTPFDPYYDDSKIPEFLVYVCEATSAAES